MDGARAVSFPAPMGNRTVYRVVDIADHFIQPHYFRTQTVEFRIGSELRALNLLLSAVRRIRQVLGISLRWLIPIGRALIHVSALLGSTAGGVMVEISGYSGNERLSETWCVSAGEGGERIPAVLTAIAADMVLRGEITGNGIVPLPDWITRDRLVAELAARKIRVAVRSEGREWRAFDDGAAFTKSAPILPLWRYNAHSWRSALLLLKGNQRIVVINAPWYLLSSEPVSLPHLLKWPDRTSVVPPRCPEVPLGKVWYR